MTSEPSETLLMSDLREVVDTVARALKKEQHVDSIAILSDLGDVPRPGSAARSKERWTPVFEYALQEEPETLPILLKNIRMSLVGKPRAQLDEALRDVRVSCVSRFTRTSHPKFSDQIDALITASTVQGMINAARTIRNTALSIRRLLMRPLMADTFLRIEQELEAFFPDPEWLRMQLADQAVNVVTAIDYLLSLLFLPNVTSAPPALGTEADYDRGQGRSEEERLDWLTKRRLAARGTAVQQSTRLLLALRGDIA
jgi:hypothetical protein